MKDLIKRLGALTCGQVLALSLLWNIALIAVIALILLKPNY